MADAAAGNDRIPGLKESGWPTGGSIWQKIDLVYGNPQDGTTTGGEGGPCLEHEEWRRNLPPRTLENLQWHSDEATAEYRTGSDKKLVGVCFGSGETFGPWDAYTLFHAVDVDPMEPCSGLCSIERGDRVLVCGQHLESAATVVRILRGKKQSGTAAAPKEQHVFYVLLKVGSQWKYIALKHVGYCGGYKYYLHDECTLHELAALESSRASNFRPKSVAAVAADAARFASDQSGGKPKAPLVSRALSKRSGKRPRDAASGDNDGGDDDVSGSGSES